jgi:FKBP-type peptidyl-prolyl cis-trans isomerase
MKGIAMTKRILMVAMAAAALTLSGCNKEKEADVSTSTEAVDPQATPANNEQSEPTDTSAPAPTATPSSSDPHTSAPGQTPAAAATGGEVTLPGGTKYVDVVVGTGAEATPGKTVSVHYTGTLTNGTKFDSSRDRGTPFDFVLGQGRVIQGWEQGVAGMKVGGQRKLTIPPDQGYGDQAMGPIPPNSTLLFDVELVDVK